MFETEVEGLDKALEEIRYVIASYNSLPPSMVARLSQAAGWVGAARGAMAFSNKSYTPAQIMEIANLIDEM